MKQMTIRGVPPELARALQEECKRRGSSLNQAVLDLLRQALGLGPHKFDNGLSKFAGQWSAADLAQFELNTSQFEQIDPELWK